jgi:hypothetical protein
MPVTFKKVLLAALVAAWLPQVLPAQAPATYSVGTIVQVSNGCTGSNKEVEQAIDTTNGNYVYEAWIGCGGIGFARSTDGGLTWSAPMKLHGTVGAWDPTVAVAPSGTVYVAYNTKSQTQYYPVVVASFDHGVTFPQSTSLTPPGTGNWGDRVFLATGPDGTVYATWNYGPDSSLIKLLCTKGGSCSYSAGDLNIVMQKSTDGGLTFGPMTNVSPHYPNGGGIAAPMVIEAGGQIDTYYMAQTVVNTVTDTLTAGTGRFTDSLDGGQSWATPKNLEGKVGKTALPTWWVDGAIGIDSAGNLYTTFDTQGKNSDGSANDIGWFCYSTNHGKSWSAPIQAIPDQLNVPHIMAVAGGGSGIAYVAWLSPSDSRGYALYLRTYSLTSGWLSDPVTISTQFGSNSIWPGDTFGITTVGTNSLMLSWGSAVGGSQNSAIFAVPVQVQF